MVLDVVCWIVACCVLVPVAVLVAEVVASLLPGGLRGTDWYGPRPSAAVLIPAHDEEAVIANTLNSVLTATGPDDRVLVVADNCTDGTAEVARALGADVVERNDVRRRGKGYALDFGIGHLAEDPPDVVVVVDADCAITRPTVERLARRALGSNGPAQALNLSDDDPDPTPLQAVSMLSFRFKNLVRTLGTARLRWPCHLMGTGMALPWPLAERVSFGGRNLAEDMQLGVDTALAGHPAVFCPEALVTSAMPKKVSAFVSQRTRWEHGSLRTALVNAPRLVWCGLRRLRPSLIGFALDLCVPPLAMLCSGLLAAALLTGVAWLCGASAWPGVALVAGGFSLGLAILAGWAAHCSGSIPFRTFLLVPGFVLRKLPIYGTFLSRRGGGEWVRTERDVPVRPMPPAASPSLRDTPVQTREEAGPPADLFDDVMSDEAAGGPAESRHS